MKKNAASQLKRRKRHTSARARTELALAARGTASVDRYDCRVGSNLFQIAFGSRVCSPLCQQPDEVRACSPLCQQPDEVTFSPPCQEPAKLAVRSSMPGPRKCQLVLRLELNFRRQIWSQKQDKLIRAFQIDWKIEFGNFQLFENVLENEENDHGRIQFSSTKM